LGAAVYLTFIYSFIYYGIKNYRLSNNNFEKQFSIIYLAIIVVYIVPWLGLNSGFHKSVNILFFAISGVALSPLFGDRKAYK